MILAALITLLIAGRPATADSVRHVADPRTGALVVDRIVVEKKHHRLTLYHAGRALRTYSVALGGNPVGDKERAGDNRTPEGVYTIDARLPQSHYHLALHISYPDAAHRARAARHGVSPGGDVMIHGLPNGKGYIGSAHRMKDWTLGCIAVTDAEIEEIWRSVRVGTRIEIRP